MPNIFTTKYGGSLFLLFSSKWTCSSARADVEYVRPIYGNLYSSAESTEKPRLPGPWKRRDRSARKVAVVASGSCRRSILFAKHQGLPGLAPARRQLSKSLGTRVPSGLSNMMFVGSCHYGCDVKVMQVPDGSYEFVGGRAELECLYPRWRGDLCWLEQVNFPRPPTHPPPRLSPPSFSFFW